ncbi:MAG: CooT family nickel-binding protein [Lachnospiraceae bacterium]|nr:CooT family nickel-binding protein [Lachnospiraceae bacterium]MCI9547274.1 CooT family nickel-binding protein [Lachnospiraceae bacterium]
MCLATVIRKKDGSTILKNVSRIDVEGETLRIRDVMGDEKEVQGTIRMVDLANSIVELECVE